MSHNFHCQIFRQLFHLHMSCQIKSNFTHIMITSIAKQRKTFEFEIKNETFQIKSFSLKFSTSFETM
jgi:hypothetical protein